jgi:phenylpyruvate tautomerase PptA (4-oxalocrotonate tautomerase family)
MLWRPGKGWTWQRAAWLAVAVIAVICPGSVSGREDSARPGTPAGTVTTVPLEYQETRFQFLYRDVPVERRLAPFPKESASAHGPVVRGVLKFGSNPSNAIPFVWQGGAKKLFLDLNRNQDLTDDPAGELPATALFSAGASFIHQVFTNVPLAFPASSAGAPMLVDLEVGMDLARRPGEPLFTACLRSYWQGKVTREGQEWQVGLMQNLSDQPGSFQQGELLLRPWEERNQRFIASCEVPMDTLALAWTGKNWMVRASDAFAFSPKVFFEGHACQLDWSAEPRGREESLALRVTEQQTALGELRITGSFVQRLVLAGGPYMVVLNQPAASVSLPPGRYHPYRVWLKQGKAEAYFNYGMPQSGKANVVEEITGSQMPVLGPPPSAQAVVVDEGRTAVLAVGGPLTNSVSAAHRGGNLLLSYRLIGAGGGKYWLAKGGDGKSPHFTVGKSGKRIGSGQFEFG